MIDKLKIIAGASILAHIIACLSMNLFYRIDIHNTQWDYFACLMGAIIAYAYFEKRGWTNDDEESLSEISSLESRSNETEPLDTHLGS